jgi:hypothetical protein
MTDRELLELAAKAAKIEYIKPAEGYDGNLGLEAGSNPMRTQSWNPLKDDGDALRLAVTLRLNVVLAGREVCGEVYVEVEDYIYAENSKVCDPYAATRRAIVRAAAEIGENMP